MFSVAAVTSDLFNTTTDSESKAGLEEFYIIAIDADSIARFIAFAIEQPANVTINELSLRLAAQVS